MLECRFNKTTHHPPPSAIKGSEGGAHTTKEKTFSSDHGDRRDKAANWGKGKADTALDLLP